MDSALPEGWSFATRSIEGFDWRRIAFTTALTAGAALLLPVAFPAIGLVGSFIGITAASIASEKLYDWLFAPAPAPARVRGRPSTDAPATLLDVRAQAAGTVRR